jgi:hypothetical protein
MRKSAIFSPVRFSPMMRLLSLPWTMIAARSPPVGKYQPRSVTPSPERNETSSYFGAMTSGARPTWYRAAWVKRSATTYEMDR